MEWLILICIALFIYWRFIKSEESSRPPRQSNVIPKNTRRDTSNQFSSSTMPDFEMKVEDYEFGEGDNKILGKSVRIRGIPPVPYTMDLITVTKVRDITDGEEKPVMSFVNVAQEPNSAIFRHITRIGTISPNQGYIDWVQVGALASRFLDVPFKGRRKLKISLLFVDEKKCPESLDTTTAEMISSQAVFHVEETQISLDFDITGYEEIVENQHEANALGIKLGIAVAMSDGNLDDAEGLKIKEWITKKVNFYEGKKKSELKKIYNDALKTAYKEAKEGDLVLSSITGRLNEIGENRSKYDAIELCYIVMAADGVASPEELRMINKLAKSLQLDAQELEIMRDKQMINISAELSESSIEETLGIDVSWSNEKIKGYLRDEFQKWNGRLNVVKDEKERDNIQKKLNDIAELRKKYS